MLNSTMKELNKIRVKRGVKQGRFKVVVPINSRPLESSKGEGSRDNVASIFEKANQSAMIKQMLIDRVSVEKTINSILGVIVQINEPLLEVITQIRKPLQEALLNLETRVNWLENGLSHEVDSYRVDELVKQSLSEILYNGINHSKELCLSKIPPSTTTEVATPKRAVPSGNIVVSGDAVIRVSNKDITNDGVYSIVYDLEKQGMDVKVISKVVKRFPIMNLLLYNSRYKRWDSSSQFYKCYTEWKKNQLR